MCLVSLLLSLLSLLALSQARVVSRCELRDELLKHVTLPKNLQKKPELAMARVICEVERFAHLDTHFVREFSREIIDPGDTTPAPTTAPPRPRTTTTTTTSTTTAPPRPHTTTTTTSTTTAPPRPRTTTTTTNKQPPITASLTPERLESNSTAVTTPPPRPPTTTTTTTLTTTTTRANTTPLARGRRPVRGKRASISVLSVRFFGIFQFSDQKYCTSGYSASEDRCTSDCYAFADDDISDDVACFIKENLFWEVYRGAQKSCRPKNTLKKFFQACDAGAEAEGEEARIRSLFISGGSYK